MFEIKDGTRTLQFNGKLLAESSSWRRGSYRWIEFKLYKTDNGSYVLSRVGVSIVYHGATCPLVARYSLNEASRSELDSAAVLCGDQRDSCPVACQPDDSIDLVFPEKYRYWAQVSEDPQAVLEALYKYDQGGARYLTKVAQRLLEQAADADQKIEKMYRVEIIP